VFELTSGRIVCVIADVCGKGVGAALFMSLVRSLIRSYLERCEGNGEELCAAAAHANDYIARHHNRDSSRTCMFATAFLLSLEASSGQCTYVNAGHVQPFLFGGGRQTGLLEPTGPGLGLAPAMRFRSAQTTIARGQSLFMYTDGVNEARDVHDELFGKERLRTILERMQVSGAGEVNERVDRALIEHRRTRPEEDDTTMLAVMRCAPSTVGVPQ
jgi:sigma-B regulation protein RsbU (phosphoserine phosphatase)